MAVVTEQVAHPELVGGTQTTLHSHGGGSESENIVRTIDDITNNTTAFADITELSFTMVADKDYIFEAWIIFQSSATGTGIKFAGNSAAAATTFGLIAHIPINITLYASCCTLAARTYNTGTPSVSVDAANSNLLCKIDGLVRCGASGGTFALRFAAETTGTVKIMTGSTMRYRQTN